MPLSQARNDKEVLAMLRSPIAKAINYVIDKIYDENIGAIHDIVYMAYSPEEYERTGDFYRAWGMGEPTKALNERTTRGEFTYKPDKMSIGSTDPKSSNYAQHIGVADKFKNEDARPYLAEIIYGATKWGNAFGDNFPKKRDAWEELNKRIGRRKMKQWMKEGLEAAGLKVQMHNKAIEVTTTKVD